MKYAYKLLGLASWAISMYYVVKGLYPQATYSMVVCTYCNIMDKLEE